MRPRGFESAMRWPPGSSSMIVRVRLQRTFSGQAILRKPGRCCMPIDRLGFQRHSSSRNSGRNSPTPCSPPPGIGACPCM